MHKDIAVLFSGGTDSTLAAALMAERFDKIHLLTYSRFGIFSSRNAERNAQVLKNRFKDTCFAQRIIKINKLFKYLSYEDYLGYLFRYRFFLLSTCGLCNLAMHARTIVFCLENNISEACDGANKSMRLFPAQMPSVAEEIKKMYSGFGINYSLPVFHLENPSDTGFMDRLGIKNILPDFEFGENNACAKDTTGYKLFELGLMPAANVKGTVLDRKMQPRCFQFILFRIFAQWYYLYNHTYEQYEKMVLEFFTQKIKHCTHLIEEYSKKKEKSRLFRLIED